MNLGNLLKKITTNLSNKVNKSGDTMTGALTINMAHSGGTCQVQVKSSANSRAVALLVGAGGSNSGLYDVTNSEWIIDAPTAGGARIPTWASIGSANQPVYFNSSGVPTPCTARFITSESLATDDSWSYRIWSDGFKECWRRVKITDAINSAWGSVFESASHYYSYPSAVGFTYMPTCLITIGGSQTYAAWISCSGAGSKTRTHAFWFNRATAANSMDVYVDIYACGK